MGVDLPLAELASGSENAAPPLADDGQRRLAASLFQLLAEGRPVETGQLARAVGRTEQDVARDLSAPFFETLGYRDADGRIIGFGGLGLSELGETRHRLHLGGRELYAWCAEDALFLPMLLDRKVRVESVCPKTGEPISLTVSPDGFSDLDPPGAVMSFLEPAEFTARGEADWGGDVIRNGCHYIHFFASSNAAGAWIAEHSGTVEIAISDGFEVGRRWVEHAFGLGSGR